MSLRHPVAGLEPPPTMPLSTPMSQTTAIQQSISIPQSNPQSQAMPMSQTLPPAQQMPMVNQMPLPAQMQQPLQQSLPSTPVKNDRPKTPPGLKSTNAQVQLQQANAAQYLGSPGRGLSHMVIRPIIPVRDENH